MGKKNRSTKKNTDQRKDDSTVLENTQIEILQTLKQAKTRDKSRFTKEKNRLCTLLDEDLPSRRKVRELIGELCLLQENILETIMDISKIYKESHDIDMVTKFTNEMETIEFEFNKIEALANEYLESRTDEESSIASSTTPSKFKQLQSKQRTIQKQADELEKEMEKDEENYKTMKEKMEQEISRKKMLLQEKRKEANQTYREVESTLDDELGITREGTYTKTVDDRLNPLAEEYRQPVQLQSTQREIGQDLWKQLKRVSIPVFNGEKRSYEAWKAAFYACVDKAPATAEYKLLQLRQYVSGEALKAIEGLGHSAAAYEAAKRRLDRKFGGKRRQIALCFEELDNIVAVHQGNAKELERLADLLDVAILNLQEAGRHEELGNGTFYTKLLKKLPESMIAQYQRWLFDQKHEESVEVLREWILQESEFRTVAAETLHGLTSKTGPVQKRHSKVYFTRSGSTKRQDAKFSCAVCNKEHPLWKCDQFRGMTVKERWQMAKNLALCYRCLEGGHLGQACTRSRICGIDSCKKSHNRLLHGKEQLLQSRQERSRETSKSKIDETANVTGESSLITEGEHYAERTHTARDRSSPDDEEYVALRTVPVVLKNKEREVTVNALLDDASTKTYINSDVAAELGLKGTPQIVKVNVLNNQVEEIETMPVEFQLESIDGKMRMDITAFTADKVTGNMKAINWKRFAKQYKHLEDITFPSLNNKTSVDMLIGMDFADLHFSKKDVKGKPGEPIARLTPLGWTCIGEPLGIDAPLRMTRFVRAYVAHHQDDTSKLLQRFWTVEEVSKETAPVSQEERAAIDAVQESLQWDGQRYQVNIPWKMDAANLPDNYAVARNRLQCTEKKLLRSPAVAETYKETLQQYLVKGYMRKVTAEETRKKSWYLPHFPVIREDKATTKVRIVFDAAAKSSGLSLNDAIYQGPKLQRDLSAVLLRFRRHPIALVCDIAEMYLRIGLSPNDRQYHRLLWRDLDVNKTPEVYEMRSLVFGSNAAPFIAQFVSQEHARKYATEAPAAAETILESTYMDDSMDSVKSIEEGIKLYKELSWMWGKANMHPRKWLSNSQEILSHIPIADRASTVDLQDETLPSVKTLGVMWKAKEDVFTFKATPPPDNFVYTKRNFLRKIATLFDPLGFLGPFLIRAKVLLQDMWLSGIDWDEAMTEEQEKRARRWFNELNHLQELNIPRSLQELGQVKSFTIHTFVDASEQAFGAVVYARCRYITDRVTNNIVCSKSRVAPLSSTSIPRLELCGAVLGLRLSQMVAQALKIDIKYVTFWTDSMNVLHWIRNQSRKFKPFVANRVGEIHASTEPSQWKHVQTKMNPADDITRGLTIEDMKDRALWWQGPEFILQNEDEWPSNSIISESLDDKEERKSYQVGSTLFGIAKDELQESRLAPKRHSDWSKLTRLVAWTYRFINNCKLPKGERNLTALQPDEILDAEHFIIRSIQRKEFPCEYKNLAEGKAVPIKSEIIVLNPRMDEDGLLRADGRIVNADYLPFNTRYPIILPRKSWVTKLIVKKFHEDGNHTVGTNHTLAKISTKYWIPKAREEIREWEKECCQCMKNKAKAASQIMAPLPSIRTRMPLRAFARSSVDFGGPYLTMQGRGKPRMKRYLCLFTCLTSRAVHLEMAYGLDTDSFLNAFYRMVNRRGPVDEILSDNATNFIGANRELKDLVGKLDRNKIQKSTVNRGVKWHFNPPLAPHFGGAHETMIKAAKRAIHAILGNADITDEELITAFTGAEALVNSRPLTYQSASPKDDVPLTPNHFLFGQAGGEFAPESVDTTSFSLKKRWRRIQELVRHFWKRWMREWLPGLNVRRKWVKSTKDVKVGDIVLLIDPQNERGKWPMARVMEVYPGNDGRVRVVKLRVGQKELNRPITKICPLECDVNAET